MHWESLPVNQKHNVIQTPAGFNISHFIQNLSTNIPIIIPIKRYFFRSHWSSTVLMHLNHFGLKLFEFFLFNTLSCGAVQIAIIHPVYAHSLHRIVAYFSYWRFNPIEDHTLNITALHSESGLVVRSQLSVLSTLLNLRSCYSCIL